MRLTLAWALGKVLPSRSYPSSPLSTKRLRNLDRQAMLPTSQTMSIPEFGALSWMKGKDAEEDDDGFHRLLEASLWTLFPGAARQMGIKKNTLT